MAFAITYVQVVNAKVECVPGVADRQEAQRALQGAIFHGLGGPIIKYFKVD